MKKYTKPVLRRVDSQNAKPPLCRPGVVASMIC